MTGLTGALTAEECAFLSKTRDGRSKFVQISDVMLDQLFANWSDSVHVKVASTEGPLLQLMFRKEYNSMTIEAMQEGARASAEAHGFRLTPEDVPRSLMLIVTELAEAMEDFRKPADPSLSLGGSLRTTHVEDDGKPCGFPSELADVVIRVGGLASSLGINLTQEIERKMAYNATRPYRHGNKRA